MLGGWGRVPVRESTSAGEKDCTKKQYERPIMKLKILFFGFSTFTCIIPHRALSYFLRQLYIAQNKKCALSYRQFSRGLELVTSSKGGH